MCFQIFQSRGSLSQHHLYPLDSSVPAFPYGFQPNTQMPSLHSTGTETQFPVNNLSAALHRNSTMQLPAALDGFGEVSQQVIKKKNMALLH